MPYGTDLGMSILLILIPVTFIMGVASLGAFYWSVRNGQFDDLQGDASRILLGDDSPKEAKLRTLTHSDQESESEA